MCFIPKPKTLTPKLAEHGTPHKTKKDSTSRKLSAAELHQVERLRVRELVARLPCRCVGFRAEGVKFRVLRGTGTAGSGCSLWHLSCHVY